MTLRENGNLLLSGTTSTTQLNATSGADATPAIIATNTGGLDAKIQRWVGHSDSMEMVNLSTGGDYALYNTQQNNGIDFYDGTGGLAFRYNNAVVAQINSTGGFRLESGSYKIGTTGVINSSRQLINIAGYSQTSGNASIEHASSPTFELKDTTNNVTFKAYAQDSNAFVGTTSSHSLNIGTGNTAALTLDTSQNTTFGGNLYVPQYIYHNGDTNTYIRFTGDAITMRAGGKDMINIIEGSDDYVEIDGRLQLRDSIDLKMFHSSATTDSNIHMPRNGMITFYGDESTHHGIGSRNQSNGEADDLLITSYGAVYIDLDSNSNNSSGADFVIGRHNSTSANLFSVSGEDGDTIASGDVTAFGSPSDIRLKENIETIDNPIDKVKELRGVTFNYKKDGKKSTGLIAQELEKVLPEVVYETHDINDESDKFKAVRYGNIVGLLVEAIKEQQKEIDELKEQVKGGTNGDN